ncbi:clathrin adaptor complex small chain-domain-containing protein [Ochromonadaceae sp. CCMP2298]|nr:clathrin adaptor complex small chain-domain-containing protein [Ochromonadaceae sp. CCMP2298]
MIKGILIVNNFGKPRLVKFYQSVTNEDEQQNVIRKVFQQVAQRPDSFCNYLEGSIPEWGEKTKIIYRHYATLYFIFAVDQQESDLGILDLIQVFVEALDKCFENVCELDLIFHSDKVNYILDEIIMAGMVLETNINHILSAVQEQSNLHTASIQTLHNASAAQIQMSSAASHATDIGGKIFSSISGSFAN